MAAPNLNSGHRSIPIVELPDAFVALKTLLFGQQQELPQTWFESKKSEPFWLGACLSNATDIPKSG